MIRPLGDEASTAQAPEDELASRSCPHCGAALRETARFCTQCGTRLEGFTSKTREGWRGTTSPLQGLTPQEVPELFQTKRPGPGETLGPASAPSLPEWLDIPPLAGVETAPGPSAHSAIASRPAASTGDLPSLPSELPPASIPSASLPPHPVPLLAARRVRRLQELAERGPWGGADLGRSAGGRKPAKGREEVHHLPRELPSILLAECRPGSTTTVLVEAIEGRPRFVTAGGASTDGDLIPAIQQACEVIAARTGRRLLDEDGTLLIPQTPAGQGVDRFVAVVGMSPLPQGVFTPAEGARYRESWKDAQGVGQLQAWSGDVSLRSGPSCLGTVIRYLGEAYLANVVGLDLGLAQSWLVAWYQGRLTVITGSGLGMGAEGALYSEARGLAQALITGLWRQCAVESESISRRQPPAWDLVVVRGPAVATGFAPLEIARLLVDVLQPASICTLLWDRDGLAVPLGALAVKEPAIAACLLDGDAFLRLGTLIAPRGRLPRRGTALRFTLAEPEGRRQQGSVAAGHLHPISLPLGHSATLTLHPAPGLELGGGRPGQGAQAEVPGGLVGLLFDGRGRPLPPLD